MTGFHPVWSYLCFNKSQLFIRPSYVEKTLLPTCCCDPLPFFHLSHKLIRDDQMNETYFPPFCDVFSLPLNTFLPLYVDLNPRQRSDMALSWQLTSHVTFKNTNIYLWRQQASVCGTESKTCSVYSWYCWNTSPGATVWLADLFR